ncbi:gliding motility protein GldM [bacterium]|nr:gliding motility protein GldM [bacterium]
MAGGKLSPRQKMINMMYLVLIALLALNVSKEILKSFFLMEQSFVNAGKNIDVKNEATMAAFESNMQKQAAKTKPYYERAKQAVKIASEFDAYVEDIKTKMVEWYEREDGTNNTPLKAPDQMEKHANYFVFQEKGIHGKEFQDKINETREKLLQLLIVEKGDTTMNIPKDVYEAAAAATQLRAEDPPQEGGNKATWISENLEHQPASGLMAILSRIQNDAKTLESDVLTKLAQQINASDYKFDKLDAKVLASSNYVMEGESYEADILLVASNSKGEPVIKVGENDIPVESGVGKYSVQASGVGIKTFTGMIIIDGAEGKKEFPFSAEYQVFKPAATIAATEMNLLYVGLDNPMSVSVPGFSASDVIVSPTAGLSLSSQGGGKYNAKVDGSQREVYISAAIKKDGATKVVGREKFRVRRLPQPVAQLGGLPNDGLPKAKAQIMAQTSILASMGQGFAYDLNYRVQSFRFIFAPARRPATMVTGSGSALNAQMQAMIRSASPGDRILIEGIRASEARYGFNANLSPIVITIR